MNRKTIISVVIVTLFLTSEIVLAESLPKTDWPMFRGNLLNEGNSDSQAPQTNQTLWKFNTGGQVGSPTIADGIAYAGSYDRKIYAFNATNGHL